MLGVILGFGAFAGAEFARRSVRRGLFKTMLKGGLVKGVSGAEAGMALGSSGKALFANLYKTHRGQVAKFAKGVAKGGDDFIEASVSGASHFTVSGGGRFANQMRATQALQKESLALGVHKYNTVGGIGGLAAGYGMLSIGGSIGAGTAGMMEQVPLPSQEMQSANMYIMPRHAHTQRQRALQAISMTQLNLRSAFGQEALYQHR